MRALVLMITFVGMLPLAWAIPYVGVLLWCWISIMAPHQIVYGLPSGLRMNLMIAVLTILGFIFSSEKKKLPINPTTIILMLLFLQFTLSSLFSLAPEKGWNLYERHVKTLVLVFMVFLLINSKVRIQALVFILVISIGYYAVYGGIVSIISGGGSQIVGPPFSPIGDNNHMALAMVVYLPLMNYLRLHSEQKIVRIVLIASMLLCVIAVLFTYSRGGFISLSAMLFVLWWRSSYKLISVIILAVVLASSVQFLPERWTARMNTIEGAEETDGSFQARLRAWETSFNLGIDRPLIGGGFSSIEAPHVYNKYKPANDPTVGRAAHSIYFQVFGDLGITGFMLFLLLLAVAIWNSFTVRRLAKNVPELYWARDLASMVQVSLAGFVVGGAALSMAYFDGFLILMVILEILRGIVIGHRKSEPETILPVVPAWRQA